MIDEIEHDELWPREPLFRYRLYSRRGQEFQVVAVSEDLGGIGLALGTLHEDCKEVGSTFAQSYGMAGILDTCPGGEPREIGEWILLPWAPRE